MPRRMPQSVTHVPGLGVTYVPGLGVTHVPGLYILFSPSLFFNEAVDNSQPVDNFSLLICFSFVFARSSSFVKSHTTPAAQGLSSVAHRAKEENRPVLRSRRRGGGGSDKKCRRAKRPDGKRKKPLRHEAGRA